MAPYASIRVVLFVTLLQCMSVMKKTGLRVDPIHARTAQVYFYNNKSHFLLPERL